MKKLNFKFQISFFILIAIILNIFYPPYLFSSSTIFIFFLPLVLVTNYYNINYALFLLFIFNGLYFPLIGRIQDFSFSGELGKVIVPIIYFNLIAYLFVHLVNNIKQKNILNNFVLEAEKSFLITPYRKEEFIFLFLKLMQKYFNIEKLFFCLDDNFQISFYWEKEHTKLLKEWIKNSIARDKITKLYLNQKKYFFIYNNQEFKFLIFNTYELLSLSTLEKVAIIFENYLKTYNLYLKIQKDKDKFKEVINSTTLGLLAIKNSNEIVYHNKLVSENILNDLVKLTKIKTTKIDNFTIDNIFLPKNQLNFYLIQNQKDKLYLKQLLEFEKNFNLISSSLTSDVLKTLYLVKKYWGNFIVTNDFKSLHLSKKEMKCLILKTENLLDLCKIAAGRQLLAIKKKISFKNLLAEISFLFNTKLTPLNNIIAAEILNIDVEKIYQILQIINYVFKEFQLNYFNLNEKKLIIKIKINNSLNYKYFNLGVHSTDIYNLKNHLSLQGFLYISLIKSLNITYELNTQELLLKIPI